MRATRKYYFVTSSCFLLHMFPRDIRHSLSKLSILPRFSLSLFYPCNSLHPTPHDVHSNHPERLDGRHGPDRRIDQACVPLHTHTAPPSLTWRPYSIGGIPRQDHGLRCRE